MRWKLLKIWMRNDGTLMYSLTSFVQGNVDQICMTPTTDVSLAKTIAWAKSFRMDIVDMRVAA